MKLYELLLAFFSPKAILIILACIITLACPLALVLEVYVAYRLLKD